jgi:hypothetical protein
VKKVVLILWLICLVIMGVNVKAQAAPDYILCTVTGAGSGAPSYGYVYLSYTYNQNPATAIAFLDPQNTKEMLAIALTAMASTQKVRAFFDPATVGAPPNNYTGVQWMYLTNEP